MTKRPTNTFEQYHAHVYFDATSVERAALICSQAGKQFGVAVGRVHQKRVGPHPCWSCQLAFDKTQFALLMPWLEKNREGLSVLIHGLTGHDLQDHTQNASWLGAAIPLNLSVFTD